MDTKNIPADTEAGTAIMVNSTTGKRPATFVRFNSDGRTATVKMDGKSRKVRDFNVYPA